MGSSIRFFLIGAALALVTSSFQNCGGGGALSVGANSSQSTNNNNPPTGLQLSFELWDGQGPVPFPNGPITEWACETGGTFTMDFFNSSNAPAGQFQVTFPTGSMQVTTTQIDLPVGAYTMVPDGVYHGPLCPKTGCSFQSVPVAVSLTSGLTPVGVNLDDICPGG